MQMDKISIVNIGLGMLGAFFFFIIGYVLRKYTARMKIKHAEERSKVIVEEAKKEAESRRREAQLEAKDLLLKMRSDFERESKERRRELAQLERRLLQREENLDRRIDILDKKEKETESKIGLLRTKERELQDKDNKLIALIQEEKERLQKVSGMTVDEAKSSGAQGVFDNKYGNTVSVYKVGDFSSEICGGPHVNNTNELGTFKIKKQKGIAAGVRRIRAILEKKQT